MKTLQQRERVTRRMKNALCYYEDKPRARFVVYRRARGITRRTSVRYDNPKTRKSALARATELAARLKAHDPARLAQFTFE